MRNVKYSFNANQVVDGRISNLVAKLQYRIELCGVELTENQIWKYLEVTDEMLYDEEQSRHVMIMLENENDKDTFEHLSRKILIIYQVEQLVK